MCRIHVCVSYRPDSSTPRAIALFNKVSENMSFQIPCLLQQVETTAVDGSVPVAFCHIT